MVRRGDVVLVSAPGDYGKPRPAILVQNDLTSEIVDSRTVCLLTSHLLNAPVTRVTLEPSDENGLRQTSQVQVDKLITLDKEKVRGPIGRLTVEQISAIDRLLLVHLDLT